MPYRPLWHGDWSQPYFGILPAIFYTVSFRSLRQTFEKLQGFGYPHHVQTHSGGPEAHLIWVSHSSARIVGTDNIWF